MNHLEMRRGSILFAAAAMSLGTFTMFAQGFVDEPVPPGPDKVVDRPVGEVPGAVKDLTTGVDEGTGDAKADAACTPDIRKTLATVTEAAVTKGGFKGLASHFVDADRTRLGNYQSSEEFSKLDGRIDSFLKNWQSKYGQEFSFASNADSVLGDSFARISRSAAGDARISDALKKTGFSDGDAPSTPTGAGNVHNDGDRKVATVVIAGKAGGTELTIPLVHQQPDSWRIDLPDNNDGRPLHDNLLNQLTMLDEDHANWPADANEAYRSVTRHVMTAIMASPANQAGPAVTGVDATNGPDRDNTAVNKRDRDSDARTAGSAGQGKSDVAIAAQIRRAVTDTKMSINAQNSKIIVLNGKVTLRGPVKSQDEKDTIDRIATEAVGAANVDNQLEIQKS